MISKFDSVAILQFLDQHAKAAFQIRLGFTPGVSRLGGEPELPPEIAWPQQGEQALPFVAQIDLADVKGCPDLGWLAPSGRLLFFYDIIGQPWGFQFHDKAGWSVIYISDEQSQRCKSREAPEELDPEARIEPLGLTFVPIRSRPSHRRFDLGQSSWNEATTNEIDDALAEGKQFGPLHQFGGYPQPLQEDLMEEECQLASNGFGPDEYDSPFADEIRQGVGQWRLLLQLDSDDDIGVGWGDQGRLFFFIPEDAAKQLQFDKCWVILQSH